MPRQQARSVSIIIKIMSIYAFKLNEVSFTSGKPAVGDFDGDGYTDFVAPGYSANKLYIFTYASIV
jgi:hypothetical protein